MMLVCRPSGLDQNHQRLFLLWISCTESFQDCPSNLARFRCVCKSWLKYINDPYLRTIHVKEEPMPILFDHSPHDKIKISFLCSERREPVMELCYKGPHDYHVLLSLFNGLTLLCYELTLVSYEHDPFDAGTYGFAVINPLTKQRHDLPPISIKIRPDGGGPWDAVGIGFDDSTNTLKTVFVIINDLHFNVICTMVHSLGTDTWREIAQNPAHPICGDGVFAHGRLHWLSRDCNDDEIEIKRIIVWFDVKTEEFGFTDPPKPTDWAYDMELVVDLNGEVGFGYVTSTCIKLWNLKPKEEWVVHCCFDISLILSQYSGYDVGVSGCWNKDGDILLTCKGGERLFVYTLESGDLRQVLEHHGDLSARVQVYQSSLFSLTYSMD